jgi:hypothetical protein
LGTTDKIAGQSIERESMRNTALSIDEIGDKVSIRQILSASKMAGGI